MNWPPATSSPPAPLQLVNAFLQLFDAAHEAVDLVTGDRSRGWSGGLGRRNRRGAGECRTVARRKLQRRGRRWWTGRRKRRGLGRRLLRRRTALVRQTAAEDHRQREFAVLAEDLEGKRGAGRHLLQDGGQLAHLPDGEGVEAGDQVLRLEAPLVGRSARHGAEHPDAAAAIVLVVGQHAQVAWLLDLALGLGRRRGRGGLGRERRFGRWGRGRRGTGLCPPDRIFQLLQGRPGPAPSLRQPASTRRPTRQLRASS